MSEERNFDEHLRKEFENYSPEVAPHIWDNIVAARKKRKPVGFWWNFSTSKNIVLLAGAILALIVGGVIASRSFTSSDIKKITSEKNTSSLPTNNTVDNKKTITATENENKNSTGTNSVNGINNDQQNNSTIPADNKVTNNAVSQNPFVASQKEIAASAIKRDYVSHSILVKTKHAFNTNASVETNEENAIINENKNASASPDNSFGINNTTRISTKNNSHPFSRLLFASAEKPLFTVTPANSALQKKNIPAIYLPECPTIEKDAAGNKRYLEVYISPDYALRTLTDTANSVYLQKRKQSAQFSSAFSAGVRYTKVFNNGMSVRAALNYSQINEKFSFVQGNVVQVTYTIDPVTGDTTGSYTVRGTRYQTTYNHYRSLDIPLTIGYEFGNGRFHANINAGLIANIYSWQKGEVLDTNYLPVNITTGKSGSSPYQFKTNIGLGTTAGISMYYKLTEQMHFFAEPYIRYNFQPMSSDNLTLRQKYTTMGLRLGLRLDLPYPGSVIKR